MNHRKPFYDEDSFVKAIKLFRVEYQYQFVTDHKDEIDCISQHAADPMSIHIKITRALDGIAASKQYAEQCIPLLRSANDMFNISEGLHQNDRLNYFTKVDALMMEKNKVKVEVTSEVKATEPVTSPLRSPSPVTLFAVPSSQPVAEAVVVLENACLALS